MATPVKAGARNEKTATNETYTAGNEVHRLSESALIEVGRMRDAQGRPNYDRIFAILGQLTLQSSKVTKGISEIKAIRAAAGTTGDPEMAERVAALEAQVAELVVVMRNFVNA